MRYLLLIILLFIGQIVAKQVNTVWVDPYFFSGNSLAKSKLQNYTQSQINLFANEAYMSPTYFGQRMEAQRGHSGLVKIRSCFDYFNAIHEGYHIVNTDGWIDRNSSTVYGPQQFFDCEEVLLMLKVKVAKHSFLRHFVLNAKTFKYLPADLAVVISPDQEQAMRRAVSKGESLSQFMGIHQGQLLTNVDKFNLMRGVFDTDNGALPPLTTREFRQLKKQLSVSAVFASEVGSFDVPLTSSDKRQLAIFDSIVQPALRQHEITNINHGVDITIPADSDIRYYVVARGDFTGDGYDDILLERTVDLSPGGGHPPWGLNQFYILTRKKANGPLVNIK